MIKPLADIKEPESAPPPPSAYQRPLLITVIVLGCLIVAGLAAVLARIIYLAAAAPPQPAAQTEAGEKASSALPFEAQLSLPEGAVVRSTSLSGNRLAVLYDAPNGGGIAIVDLVSGRTLGRLRTAPAAPGR
jgi:hypothetical protein